MRGVLSRPSFCRSQCVSRERNRAKIFKYALRSGIVNMRAATIDTFFIRQAKRPKCSAGTADEQHNADAAKHNEPVPSRQALRGDDALPGTSAQLSGAAATSKADSRQYTPSVLQEISFRNNAAALAVVEAAAAAGGQPLLRELLVEPTWRDALAAEFDKQYMSDLQCFLHQEWSSGNTVYPPKPFIFRALNSVPLPAVRVVVLGQDPYHGPGQAMGLSFSVPRGVKVPSSLANMYKELKQDLDVSPPRHGDLQGWCHQGVLLLNAVLTVRGGAAASHSKRGWEALTNAAISTVSRCGAPGVVFLLWGKFAQSKAVLVDTKRHVVLTAPHPSGLSASRGFFGCRHFSQTNNHLQSVGLLPVTWRLNE